MQWQVLDSEQFFWLLQLILQIPSIYLRVGPTLVSLETIS